MKRVITDLTDGFPITLDELEYIQDNVYETFGGVGKGLSLGNTSTILHGIILSIVNEGGVAPTYTITGGLFYYNENVYKFDAVTTPQLLPDGTTKDDFGTNHFFNIVTATSLPVLFKDGSTKDINEEDKVIISETETIIGLNYGSSPTLSDVMYSSVPQATEIKQGKIELATDAEVIAGTESNAITPKNLKAKKQSVELILDIGLWRMSAVELFSVPTPITDVTKIISVEAYVYNDARTLKYPLTIALDLNGLPTNVMAGSVLTIQPNLVQLYRNTNGYFVSGIFDSSVIERGHLIINYLI